MRPLCPMCRRTLPLAGRGYRVGWPTEFLICRDCWKGWVITHTDQPSKVLRGSVDLKRIGGVAT